MKSEVVKLAVVTVLVMSSLSNCAEQPPQERSTASGARIIPWIEVNSVSQSSLKYYQRAVAGSQVWNIVADEVCVTTTANTKTVSALYNGLKKDCPGIQILPGIKTGQKQLGRLDNVEGWKLVAESCRLACQITGNDRCVIENETVNKIFINYKNKYPVKKGDVDWQKVEEGLRLLPQDIHYIWYPGICGGKEDQVLTTRFMELVVRTLKKVSVVSLKWSTAHVKDTSRMNKPDLQASLGVPIVPICYFNVVDDPSERKSDWKCEDLPWLIDHCTEPELFIYPGSSPFMACALGCGKVLYDDQVRKLNVCSEKKESKPSETN